MSKPLRNKNELQELEAEDSFGTKAGERLSLRSVKAATERCNGRLATEVLQ
jgi:hypothetical protein